MRTLAPTCTPGTGGPRASLVPIMIFVLLIRNGHLEVVHFLVNGKDTDPNVVNKDGDTALHLAVK